MHTRRRAATAVLIAAVAIAGCLGGLSGDGSAPAGADDAEALRNETLAADPLQHYRFVSEARTVIAWPKSVSDDGDPTRYAVEGTGTFDRRRGTMNTTWNVTIGLSLGDTTAWDITQRGVTTAVGDGKRYSRGRMFDEDWEVARFEKRLSSYDTLLGIRAMLANASVRYVGEHRIDNETLPVLSLDVAGNDSARVLAVAAAPLDLATGNDFVTSDLGPWRVDRANVTVAIDPKDDRVRRSRIVVNASVPVGPERGGGRFDVYSVTSYGDVDDTENLSLPTVNETAMTRSEDDDAVDREVESSTLDPGVNVQYHDESDLVRVAYTGGEVTENLTVRFSGWGGEAVARLGTAGDRATLTSEEFTTFGGAKLRGPTELPTDGDTVTVEVTAEAGNTSRLVTRQTGAI